MKKLIIGVDVDGVLANFNTGFARLLQKLSGRTLCDPESIAPHVWHWPQALGYTSKEVDECWRFIDTSPDFWLNLGPLPDVLTFLLALRNSGHDVYFATARPGLTAKAQTEKWLGFYGSKLPTVLITDQKGLIAKALKFDVYIDDKFENCLDVALGTGAQVYMPRTGYNRATVVNSAWRITEVGSILGMLDGEHVSYEFDGAKVAA